MWPKCLTPYSHSYKRRPIGKDKQVRTLCGKLKCTKRQMLAHLQRQYRYINKHIAPILKTLDLTVTYMSQADWLQICLFVIKRWLCPINLKTRLSSTETGANFMLGARALTCLHVPGCLGQHERARNKWYREQRGRGQEGKDSGSLGKFSTFPRGFHFESEL